MTLKRKSEQILGQILKRIAEVLRRHDGKTDKEIEAILESLDHNDAVNLWSRWISDFRDGLMRAKGFLKQARGISRTKAESFVKGLDEAEVAELHLQRREAHQARQEETLIINWLVSTGGLSRCEAEQRLKQATPEQRKEYLTGAQEAKRRAYIQAKLERDKTFREEVRVWLDGLTGKALKEAHALYISKDRDRPMPRPDIVVEPTRIEETEQIELEEEACALWEAIDSSQTEKDKKNQHHGTEIIKDFLDKPRPEEEMIASVEKRLLTEGTDESKEELKERAKSDYHRAFKNLLRGIKDYHQEKGGSNGTN